VATKQSGAIQQGGKTRISARNVLKGVVKEIQPGAVNNVVTIELPGGIEITSVITQTSCFNLDLQVGKPAYAVIKASNVMVAVDE
jgi:molybdopterin-binding protein